VVNIKVTLEDDAGVVSSDIVELRAAPVLFPDNLQAPRALYVVDLPDGQDNNRALLASFRDALPADVELNAVSGDEFFGDRWLQDNWEVGTQVMKNSDGSVREMITAMQTERYYGGQGLDAFVPGAWLGAGRGFYYPSGDETSHNYGGNLETSSPTEQDPFGRMLFGGGTKGVARSQEGRRGGDDGSPHEHRRGRDAEAESQGKSLPIQRPPGQWRQRKREEQGQGLQQLQGQGKERHSSRRLCRMGR
jgi:hypothetical protein